MFNFATLNGPTVLPYASGDFESSVVYALNASATVSAVIGANVYPVAIPEEAGLPALSYRVLSKPRERTLDGPSGIAAARLELVCRSHNYADVKAVKDAIRKLFAAVPLTLGSVSVIECKLDDESDEYEEPLESSDRGTYHTSIDFLMRFREP